MDLAARIEELERENARLRAEAEAMRADVVKQLYAASLDYSDDRGIAYTLGGRGALTRFGSALAARAGQNESMGGSPGMHSPHNSGEAGEPPAPYSREEIREALERVAIARLSQQWDTDRKLDIAILRWLASRYDGRGEG